jgi:hypothetical protein
MPKFFTVLCLVLFSFSVFAQQSSLRDYGVANVTGKSIVESPMAPVQFLLQAPNQVNGVFADASCALCGTGQQTVAENFNATISNATTGINELIMYGGYYPENIPNTTDNFTILIHSNNGGSPGTVIWSQSNLQATSRVTTGVVLFNVNEYKFTFDFTAANAIMLPSTGMYWVEIFNNSVESGNFFWETGNLDATHGVAGSGWYTTTPGTSWNLDPATDFALTVNGDDAIVPVELVSFAATSNGTEVNLNWQTATEINNKGFEIQKMFGSVFETIGYVEGNGTTTENNYYSFTDNKVTSGTYTYRLKQVDLDGTFKYSNEVEVNVIAAAVFSLAQNYPNPFNPTTNINFSIPESGNVKLAVYNTLGQEVATLVNGVMAAGQHEVTLNAQSLPSGAYIYKLQSGNSVMIKKMLLLK